MGPVAIEIRDDGKIEVTCDLKDRDNVKKVPGSAWVQAERTWTVPMSWAALLQLRGIFNQRLQVGPELTAASIAVYERRVKPALDMLTLEDTDGNPRLEPLQRVGSAFMVTAGQALNADPQGSGKTPVTIDAISRLDDPFPAIVICQNDGKTHWRDEFKGWYPDAKVMPYIGTPTKKNAAIEAVGTGEAEVLVINEEAIRTRSKLAPFGAVNLSDKEKKPGPLNEIPWRTAVADEAHDFLNPKSKMTRALWAISSGAAWRFALTGTPIARNIADLWAVMHFVAPNEYPSKTKWIDRYAMTSYNYFGGLDIVGVKPDTREELFKFVDPRFLRRPKEKILPQLEGKLPTVKRVSDLAPKQRKAYDTMRKSMLADLEGGVFMAKNPMAKTLALRLFALATGVTEETGELDENDNPKLRITLTEPSSKIDSLVKEVKGLDPSDKIVVYGEHVDALELAQLRMEKEEIPSALHTGRQSDEERATARAAFQDRRDPLRVLILSYGTGAATINLSTASTLVYLERTPSKIDDEQSIERPLRHGREGPLRVIDLVAADTVDERVEEILNDKTANLEEICRDEDRMKAWLTK